MKKLLSVVLSLAMILAICGLGVVAEGEDDLSIFSPDYVTFISTDGVAHSSDRDTAKAELNTSNGFNHGEGGHLYTGYDIGLGIGSKVIIGFKGTGVKVGTNYRCPAHDDSNQPATSSNITVKVDGVDVTSSVVSNLNAATLHETTTTYIINVSGLADAEHFVEITNNDVIPNVGLFWLNLDRIQFPAGTTPVAYNAETYTKLTAGYGVWNPDNDCVDIHFANSDIADYFKNGSNFKAISVSKGYTTLMWDDGQDGTPETTGATFPLQMSGDMTIDVDALTGTFTLHAGHNQTVKNVMEGNHTFGGASLKAYAENCGGEVSIRADGGNPYRCYYLPIYEAEKEAEPVTASLYVAKNKSGAGVVSNDYIYVSFSKAVNDLTDACIEIMLLQDAGYYARFEPYNNFEKVSDTLWRFLPKNNAWATDWDGVTAVSGYYVGFGTVGYGLFGSIEATDGGKLEVPTLTAIVYPDADPVAGDSDGNASCVVLPLTEVESEHLIPGYPDADCKAGDPVQENVKAADLDNAGSYDEVTYCTICGKEVSRTAKTGDPAVGRKASTDIRLTKAEIKDNGKLYFTFSANVGNVYGQEHGIPLLNYTGRYTAIRIVDNATDQNLKWDGETPAQWSTGIEGYEGGNTLFGAIEWGNLGCNSFDDIKALVDKGGKFEGCVIMFCIEETKGQVPESSSTVEGDGFIFCFFDETDGGSNEWKYPNPILKENTLRATKNGGLDGAYVLMYEPEIEDESSESDESTEADESTDDTTVPGDEPETDPSESGSTSDMLTVSSVIALVAIVTTGVVISKKKQD